MLSLSLSFSLRSTNFFFCCEGSNDKYSFTSPIKANQQSVSVVEKRTRQKQKQTKLRLVGQPRVGMMDDRLIDEKKKS